MSQRSTLLLVSVLALALLVLLAVARLSGVREAPGLVSAPRVEAPGPGGEGAGELATPPAGSPAPARELTRRSLANALGAPRTAWSGRVVDAIRGAPVADALVRVRLAEQAAEVTTDGAGAFSLMVPSHPDATLVVEHDAYVDLREARPDLTDGRVLRLQPSGALRGELRGPGALADGIEVGLWASSSRAFDGEPLARATPDDEQAFRFDDLAPGLYGVGVVGGRGPLVFQGGVLVKPPVEPLVTLLVPAGLALSGRVVEGEARRPIANARVQVRSEIQGINDAVEGLSRRDAETDAAGRFAIAGLAEGGLDLEVRTPWGARRRLRENLTSLGRNAEVQVVFPEPARIAGTVRTSAGAPASAVVGVLTRDDRGLRRGLLEAVSEDGLAALEGTVHAWTDADGRFAFGRVPSYEPLFLVALPDPEGAESEGPASLELDRLRAGQSLEDVELALVASASVAGRVVDEAGAPIAGAAVELVRELLSERQTIDEVETDESGAFVLHGAAPEDGSLIASHDGYDRARLRLDDVSLDDPVELRLSAAPTAVGRVVDDAGGAVADVLVRLRRDGSRRGSRWDRTDAFGRFRVERLDPGTYEVELRDGEWRLADPDGERILELPIEEELVLVAVRGPLELPASVGGEAVDADTGEPVPNLRIDGNRGGVVLIRGRRFDLEGMRPGETRLELEASGYETLRTEPRVYAPGAHVELGTFELWRAGDVRVSVVDPDGEPLRGARVLLRALPVRQGGAGAERGTLSVDERRRGRRGRRDRAWPYTRDDVPLRAYDLEVRLDDFRVHRERVELTGQRTDLRVELAKK